MHSIFKICISRNMKCDKTVGFLKYSHIYIYIYIYCTWFLCFYITESQLMITSSPLVQNIFNVDVLMLYFILVKYCDMLSMNNSIVDEIYMWHYLYECPIYLCLIMSAMLSFFLTNGSKLLCTLTCNMSSSWVPFVASPSCLL